MKKLFSNLISDNRSAFLIFFFGILTQIITWPILFMFGVKYHLNEVVMKYLNIIIVIWFFIPVISIVAIVVAIMQIRKKISLKSSIIGLIINIIWLILFLFVLYMITIVGISV